MSAIVNIIVFSALIVLLAGVSPLVWIDKADCEDFARSGAVLVLYGIFLALGDIKQIRKNQEVADNYEHDYNEVKSLDNNKTPRTEEELDEYFDMANKRNALDNSPTPQEVQLFVDSVNKKNNKIVKAREFWVVAVGTIIWGYGDLICHLFNTCNV